MIDVHGREAALVVVRIPERQLLAAVGCVERIVEVEDIAVGRRYLRGELINQVLGKPRRVRLRRCIFEAADGRLRGQCGTCFGAAPDGYLQCRIMTQLVKIIAVLVTAGDGQHAGADEFEHRVVDARGVPAIPHGPAKPRAHAHLLFGRPEQQQACIGRLVAAVEINCEFLPRHGWQDEGKRRSVGHGCGVPLRRKHARLDNGLLRDFIALRHSHSRFHQA
jgi:hypothetical protein